MVAAESQENTTMSTMDATDFTGSNTTPEPYTGNTTMMSTDSETSAATEADEVTTTGGSYGITFSSFTIIASLLIYFGTFIL